MSFQVAGEPHAWPRDPRTPPSACAVIVVDMQHDYCSPGFYIARAGYETARLSRPIAPIQRVLAAARRAGMRVFFTRHGHAHRERGDYPDTSARGEPGWEIVPALAPLPGDVIIEKSTINAFVSGELVTQNGEATGALPGQLVRGSI